MLSRENQARVRSSPRQPWATSAAKHRSESGGPSKAPGAGHLDLIGAWAFTDAVHAACASALLRFIPGVSSEASGASAPLPSRGKKVSLSKATWRLSIE